MGTRDLLVFDEASHTYRHGGLVVPGVTSILKPLVDFSRIPTDVLEAKADLGRRVHTACQFLDEDDLDDSSVQADVAPYLDAYEKFKRDSGVVIELNEQRVFNELHRYAGTLDRVIRYQGLRILMDLKTCITTPNSVGPQTAAYLRALNDPTVTHRAALRLRPDGTYRIEMLSDANDWSTFLACLTVHRHLEKHAS
jgi:hypothetical protein